MSEKEGKGFGAVFMMIVGGLIVLFSGGCLIMLMTEPFLRDGAVFLIGLVPVVARYIEDGEYKWDFPRIGITTMKRICRLPEGA